MRSFHPVRETRRAAAASVLLVAGLLSFGCAGEPPLDAANGNAPEAPSAHPFSVASCQSVDPDVWEHFTSSDANAMELLMPGGYSDGACWKGDVVGIDEPTDAWYQVAWHDEATYPGPGVPTNQATCESAWLSSVLYSDQGGAGWRAECAYSFNGIWRGTTCIAPAVAFGHACNTGIPGWTYKLATSARTSSATGAPTVPYKLDMFRAPALNDACSSTVRPGIANSYCECSGRPGTFQKVTAGNVTIRYSCQPMNL